MKGKQNISNARLEAALRKHDGIATLAAKYLKTTRQNVTQRIHRSAHLQAVIAEVDATTVDVAEGVITEALHEKDRTTARWYLERKGKDRGYGNSSTTSLAEEDVAAITAAFGGDVERLRALRSTVTQTPAPEEQG